MEHRCGERCPLHMQVTLLTGDGAPLRATIRNVSAGGMLVDGLRVSLAPYEFVDIVLALPAPAAQLWRWPAMVVRSGHGSAALMFDRLRFGDLRRLVRSLRRSPLSVRVPTGTLVQGLAGDALPPGQRYH